ncbi:MAG: hypothetical protein HYX92_10110 [Chloroflexi bacterium]|nr:hypothetical protein [Chloroflexota bacterium]
MRSDDERIIKAMRKTKILRSPKQTLVTFGNSTIHYYLLTQPTYTARHGESSETVVREGKVVAERPRVVTPHYLMSLEGFSEHARAYLEMVAEQGGAHTPGLFYRYQNEYQGLNIVSEPLLTVGHKISEELNSKGEKLAVVIKGVDELWDVSLLKFIHDYTDKSMTTNVTELGIRGLLEVDQRGVPGEARQRISELFNEVERGQLEPAVLKTELDRWGLFSEYEDRFLRLFRKS